MRNGTDTLRLDRIGLRDSARRHRADSGNKFASPHRWSSPSSCTAFMYRGFQKAPRPVERCSVFRSRGGCRVRRDRPSAIWGTPVLPTEAQRQPCRKSRFVRALGFLRTTHLNDMTAPDWVGVIPMLTPSTQVTLALVRAAARTGGAPWS
jgi:hypothetical protein